MNFPTKHFSRWASSFILASSAILACTLVSTLVSGCTSGSSIGKVITNPPVIAYTTSIQATVGVAITPVTPNVTGTVTGFTISPALPTGLTVNATTGTISGTPTQASAAATYVVTATNSAGSGTASIQIAVAIAAPSSLTYPQTSISVIVGTAITPDTPTVTGTVTGYTISPTLPAGLTISATTGTISGTPTGTSPSTSYTVTASNGTGSTSATVQIAVIVPAPSNLVYPQISIITPVGTAITPDTPTVTGTVTSYTISPALPAGLTINAATGTISGTPTAASPATAYTVTAANGTGSTTAAVQITANGSGAPTHLIYAQSGIDAFVGTAITPDTPVVTGTVTSYSVTPGLPAGLSIDAITGAISGTPTVSDFRNVTVTASNASGSTTATLVILVSPPSLVFKYPQTLIQAVIGTAITPDTPIVTEGKANYYSIGQTLPNGLTFDGSTGTFSGTPTVASAQTTYTVTGQGDSGASDSATVQIVVTPPSPVSIAYPQSWITATVGTAIPPDVPTITGALSTFTISPALPAGLNLDPATGILSGTATASIHTTAYTVTVSGSGGNATAAISITAGTTRSLLDLGTTSPASLAITSDRVLAADSYGNSDTPGKWVLWDYPAGNVLAEGPVYGPSSQGVAIAGGLAVIPTGLFEVHSSADGSLLFNLVDNFSIDLYQLAPDGSYVCGGGSGGFDVWSAGGTKEFTLPGDYSNAKVYTLPSQILIANGPYGNNVIETVQVSGGNVTLSPTINGSFVNWFGDGQRFLTNLGSTVWIYSNSGTLQSTAILSYIIDPSLVRGGGYGNWFWITNNGQGELFEVGNTTPQLTNFVPYFVSGPILATPSTSSPQVTIYDLSGASVISTVNTLPTIEGVAATFAADSSTQWVVSNQYGVVLDGATAGTTPHTFNYGKALDIAGSSTYAAVETASGQTFVYDANGTQVLDTSFTPESIVLSQNGSTLGSLSSAGAASFYALPSMSLISSPSGIFGPINLSANGQYAAMVAGRSNSPSGELVALPGPTVSIPVIAATPEIYPSADGSLVAVPNRPNGVADEYTTTGIYQSNGSLVTVVSGDPEGWIDNNSLLVATYTDSISPGVYIFYQTSVIYDASGNVKLTFPQSTLPALGHPQFLSATEVYQDGNIYSLATGAVEWNWPGLSSQFGYSNSAVLGSSVIFSAGGQVNLVSR